MTHPPSCWITGLPLTEHTPPDLFLKPLKTEEYLGNIEEEEEVLSVCTSEDK